jgi:pyruvyl transferase EpsO
MSVRQEMVAGTMPRRRPHADVMDELKSRLRRILDIVPPSTPVVYIDYPVHGNVGDLMIHAGADSFLEDYDYDIVGRFSAHDLTSVSENKLRKRIHQVDRSVAKGATIILHGGGNVGDLWPHHQTLRELLIRRYRDAPIVFFPQSVHFKDPAARAKSAEVLRQHRNVHFFVRDKESLEFAGKECDCPAEVLPDMAHYLWKHRMFDDSARIPADGTLVQRRRDKEAAQPPQPDAFDWEDLRGVIDRAAQKALVHWYRIDRPLSDAIPNWWSWYKLRDHLIGRAVVRFSRYEMIETDRLHGMILGALLGKQVRFSDNCYGKLSRYFGLWMADSDRIAPVDATGRPGQGGISWRLRQVGDPLELPQS